MDDLAFPEYKERYMTMALPLARVCALAVSNARVLETNRRAEQALRNMAGIVEHSDDAIIGKTLDGVIISWNRGAERLYGYMETEVLGRHISFLTPLDQPDEMPRMLERIRNDEQTEQFETVWSAKDDRKLNVSLQVSPVRDEAGKIVGASSISRDITKEKQRIEEERKSLEAQLLQAQKLESIGRLAGGIAHDFNNMLAIILGYSELLLLDFDVDDKVAANLDPIKQAAEQAKGLTSRLLAFARKQVLNVTHLDLNCVVSNFSRMITRLIGEDVIIKLVLEDGLPPVQADPSMLDQVLMNLAVNARDAMPDGGVLTMETSSVHIDQGYAEERFEVAPGDYARLAVTDTGVGMDRETSRMVFEPFFTTKSQGEGTGLGLSTVYGIVKQHDGYISVYSEPGHGTVFRVNFPVKKVVQPHMDPALKEPVRPIGGETILLVEDDEPLRMFIQTALLKLGYEVLCAATPKEARQLSVQYGGEIHIMLTDVVLPDMNGKDLYGILSKSRPAMRVVYMSGYTENIIAHKGVLQAGVSFIQKPFSIRQLADVLGNSPASGEKQ